MAHPEQRREQVHPDQDEDAVFKAFDAYPWTKDEAFMSGLDAILGNPSSPHPQGADSRDIATHARIFYYSQRFGVSVGFFPYHSWLARHPDHQPPQLLPAQYHPVPPATPPSDPLDWQHAAPKADLFVDKAAVSAAASHPACSDPTEPSYPMGFAEMLKMLQQGKPIPGIRQIPNTIARDPSVKPVGSRVAPKKPWETVASNTAAMSDIDATKALDSEFPPLESDPVASSSSGIS